MGSLDCLAGLVWAQTGAVSGSSAGAGGAKMDSHTYMAVGWVSLSLSPHGLSFSCLAKASLQDQQSESGNCQDLLRLAWKSYNITSQVPK